MRFAASDARRVADLKAALQTLVVDAPPALETFLPAIQDLVAAPHAFAFGLASHGETLSVDFTVGSRVPAREMHASLDRLVRSEPVGWSGYNPYRPERWQRNRAIGVAEHFGRAAMSAMPAHQQVFVPVGLGACEQLRVLLCDGSSLLAWVGGLREEAFTARERRLFQAVVPALRQRLSLERQLETGVPYRLAFHTALEAVGCAAFLARASGSIVHANAAGRALLQSGAAPRIVDVLRSPRPPSGITVTPIASLGLPEHFLVMVQAASRTDVARARAIAARWGLTPRQGQVLERLVQGDSNKTIAGALGCAEATVELHVTAALRKAGCESRAALVARFWTEPV